MKRIITFIASLCAVAALSAQSLHFAVGQVTYIVPVERADSMTYDEGTLLIVLNKTFNVADIDSIYFSKTSVPDGTVTVRYNGATAAVTVAGNVMRYLSVNARGADISILQNDDTAQEINYTLTGTSDNGSFYMDGNYKATLTLSDLTLASCDSAAINIENGKRIAIVLRGENTLTDAENGLQKACFMVNGHSEFTGDGSLTLTGRTKHAFWGDEYVQLKKSFTGCITVKNAVKDALSINQYFLMSNGTVNVEAAGADGIQVDATDKTGEEYDGQMMLRGGTLNLHITGVDAKGLKCDSVMTITDVDELNTTIHITCSETACAAKGLKSKGDMLIQGGHIEVNTAAKGLWDSTEQKTSACAGLKSDKDIYISGGTLTLSATGSGGKGVSADGNLYITGGNLTAETAGGKYYNNGTTENTDYTSGGGGGRPGPGGGWGGSSMSNYTSSAKGIKADGDIEISGDDTKVYVKSGKSEGIESKHVLTISGGTVETEAYDDAINSASHLYIKGGQVYVTATNNDGLDANGNLYIQGGTVVAYGATNPECGLDANEEGGYSVYFTGGTVVAIGGRNSTPNSSSSTQKYVSFSGSFTNGSTYLLRNGSTDVLAFTMGRAYSTSGGGSWGGPGGGGSSVSMLITSPNVTSSSYTLYKDADVDGDEFHGLYEIPSVNATGTSFGSATAR